MLDLLANLLIYVPAFLIGWFFNRNLAIRLFCWVWFLGLLWIGYGIVGDYRIYHSNPWYPRNTGSFPSMVWHSYFANRGERDSPLTLVVFTIPALGLAAFSIGAWVARRRALRHKLTKRSIDSY